MQSNLRLSWSTLGLVAFATTSAALTASLIGCATSVDDGSELVALHDAGAASDAPTTSPAAEIDASSAPSPTSPAAPSSSGAPDPATGVDAAAPSPSPSPSSPIDDAASPTPPPSPTTPDAGAPTDAGHAHDAASGADTGSAHDTGATTHDADTPDTGVADTGTTSHDAGTPDTTVAETGGSSTATPTAAELLALTTTCSVASNGKYSTDSGSAATVDICALTGAYFWKADMDVDCDGLKTAVCSSSTDPDFQNQTSATTSTGGWLDASTLPYVVIPLPSSRFDYTKSNIQLGQLVAVIYNGQVSYGVFGDEGPSDIIGESSYAMAQSLGIDPNPATGGVDSGVTYIVFTGPGAVVSPIEDHAKAVTLGQTLANKLLGK